MSSATRPVDLPYPCPRCGGRVTGVEEGIEVAEQSGVVGWKLTSRWCTQGCQLTVSDWPPDQQLL